MSTAGRKALHLATAVVIASMSSVLIAAGARATAQLIPLGALPGAGFSVANGVSADGSTVAGYSADSSFPPTDDYEAFQWTGGGSMSGLGYFASGPPSNALAVSSDGSILVGYSAAPSGLDEATRWTAGGGVTGLGYVSGYTNGSRALAVSADGATVVGESSDPSGTQEAFRWTAASGMVGIALQQDFANNMATGVSADGSLVVGWGYAISGSIARPEAFRWTANGGAVGLGHLPGGVGSEAFAVSADGSTIVGEAGDSSGQLEAFRWTAATGMVGLGTLPGTNLYTGALAVSADGSVVVGEAGGGIPFVWDATHGMRSLDQILTTQGVDISGWDLQEATGVSADGRTIVGYGEAPPQAPYGTEGFIAFLPEPAVDVLLFTGLLGLAVFGRRRT